MQPMLPAEITSGCDRASSVRTFRAFNFFDISGCIRL